MRFVGRCHAVSDLVGEKLNEQHVRKAIDSATTRLGITVRFALLAPAAETPPYYCLFLEAKPLLAASLRRSLESTLDQLLQENPQYRHAVRSGQLRTVQVRQQNRNSWQVFEKVRTELGQKAGDIKPVALDGWTGWMEAFNERP